MENIRPPAGRGAGVRPPNRFERVRRVPLELAADDRDPATEYLTDHSRSVVSETRSPDVGFRYSLNPYRGCEHGCAYCYARPTHEFLGFDAGLGFETKIVVKPDAPRLFRAFLRRPGWTAEPIALSGVTDPYQPCEKGFRVTRRCLEVAATANQPTSVITKGSLVLRDLDLLGPMAAAGLAQVNVSVTTLDSALGRMLEPRAATPAARLRTIRDLSAAGVPVRVLVAPVIPGLTDAEVPAILEAAAAAGATAAAYTLLRLPLAVEPIFVEWLNRNLLDRKDKVLASIRSVRGGWLNDATFGRRMVGVGAVADQIGQLFRTFARRRGLDGELPAFDRTKFRRPDANGQGRLF